MALSSATWNTALLAQMSSHGWTGINLPVLSNAIAVGSVTGLVGTTFSTTDTGVVIGTGTGTGVGITGVSVSTLASTIFALASASFGNSGINLLTLCTDIATVCVSQLATATLTSAHSPVFAGTGTVTVGTVNVIGSNIETPMLAAAPAFTGINWPQLVSAISTGMETIIKASGTGTVTITGAGFPGVPGAGTGSGVLS